MAGIPATGIPEALLGSTYSALKRSCGDQVLPIWGPELGSLLTANMVALPITTSGKASAAGEVRGTSTLLVPRKGATPAWRAEFADLLASYELTSVASEKNPPELEAIRQQAATFPAAAIAHVHAQIQREWRDEASRLYFVVRASIDLSGPYEQKDLDMRVMLLIRYHSFTAVNEV